MNKEVRYVQVVKKILQNKTGAPRYAPRFEVIMEIFKGRRGWCVVYKDTMRWFRTRELALNFIKEVANVTV